MIAWLRQHRYALATTIRRLAMQPFSTITNILVIALTLTVPLVGLSILESAQPLTQQIAATPQATIFLNPNASVEQGKDILKRIQETATTDAIEVTWLSRDQAYAQLRQQPGWQEGFAALPSNPLPDAIIVTLLGPDVVSQGQQLAQRWRQWPGVHQVQIDREWILRLQSLLKFAELGLLLLALGVAIIVLATVFNTVRMQALALREEITVARLVGATENFVRRPFLYYGALTTFSAGVIALLLTSITLAFLNDALHALAKSYGSFFSLHLPSSAVLVTYLALIAILGAFSARWSVTRNTRF